MPAPALSIFWLSAPFSSHMVACTLILCLSAGVTSRYDTWYNAPKMIRLIWCAFCALFPLGPALLLLAGGILANRGLTRANRYKIAQNHVPITASDIIITLRKPGVLFNLFGMSEKWMIPTLAITGVLLGALLIHLSLFFATLPVSELIYLTLLVLLFAGVLHLFEKRLFDDVRIHMCETTPFGGNLTDNMGWQLQNWHFESIGQLSIHLGLPAFLLYTKRLTKQEVPIFFHTPQQEKAISHEEILAASKRFLPVLPAASEYYKAPNIVIVQCESMFHPSLAFNLKQPYSNLLLARNEYTKCLQPLRVNIIGGGSWVSEFEAITGLDIRLFGYIGYYAHVALSPYVQHSFPHLLNMLGYDTKAYFSVEGSFYNTKNAYRNYGFSEFCDSFGLGLTSQWCASDTELAKAFIEKTQDYGDKPSCSFIVTNGAHSPYPPDLFLEQDTWGTSFAEPCDSLMNAQLNEYARRIEETATAVELIVDRLTQMELETGRPFIVVAYGDHQPHEFTGNPLFDSLRSGAPLNQTVVHIMSSMRDFTIHCDGEIPLTMVPSLLSGALVPSHDRIYAAPNLYLYERHGCDFFPTLSNPSKFGIKLNNTVVQTDKNSTQPTASAQELYSAIHALRGLGLLKSYP